LALLWKCFRRPLGRFPMRSRNVQKQNTRDTNGLRLPRGCGEPILDATGVFGNGPVGPMQSCKPLIHIDLGLICVE
jgi:hypothetical protein